MYVCAYCGRHLKKKYDNCPACGATELKAIQNIGEEIIKQPPKEGYKLNLANFNYEKKKHIPNTVSRNYSPCYRINYTFGIF